VVGVCAWWLYTPAGSEAKRSNKKETRDDAGHKFSSRYHLFKIGKHTPQNGDEINEM